MLRWELRLRPKPEGPWRPKLEVTYWVEGNEWKELNVFPKFSISKLSWARKVETFARCTSERYQGCPNLRTCANKFPVKIFVDPSAENDEPKCPNFQINLRELAKNKKTFECYLEWRPGSKPDYTDYVDWFVKHYCTALVKEYERRTWIAKSSGRTEEVVVSSDGYVFQNQEKSKSALKWELRLYPKPRGFWRPELEVVFWLEDDEWKDLNVSTHFSTQELPWAKKFKLFSECRGTDRVERPRSKCYACSKELPVKTYDDSTAHRYWPKCLIFSLDPIFKFGEKAVFRCYLEWRSGEKPDYTDCVNWFIEHFCLPLAEEYAQRIEEAKKSGSNEPVVVTSDNYVFFKLQSARESVKATRRLNVKD